MLLNLWASRSLRTMLLLFISYVSLLIPLQWQTAYLDRQWQETAVQQERKSLIPPEQHLLVLRACAQSRDGTGWALVELKQWTHCPQKPLICVGKIRQWHPKTCRACKTYSHDSSVWVPRVLPDGRSSPEQAWIRRLPKRPEDEIHTNRHWQASGKRTSLLRGCDGGS